ncbi:MAG: glutathione S-transferase family protein [Amaricoccus sp.]|uniref:glutathione S-transferase family protein n=1 Tax=Amaricoccus sp. TaxID=1872485 RepID=UPI0039E44304
MLTVYGRASSMNVQAVMWGIAELGLTAERVDAGFGFGGTDTPEYRAMNPNGLVPVLRDEHVTMFESAAILRYLAARFGRFPFWPEDPVARAPVDMWAEWGKVTLQANFLSAIFHPVLRGGAPEPKGRAALDSHLGILEAQLAAGPWVLGEAFTLADIEVGLPLYRYFTLDLERRDWPRVASYYRRLCDRPTFVEHVMIDYHHLAAMMR